MTWDDALSKTILYLHNLNRYQNPPTTSCLLSFIKRSHIFVGPQPNQTGPLNIAGGLEGEGNDLGSHHTSLETEIHHRQTDRRTDKSWGGEPTSLSVLSPLHPLKKKVKHWLCSVCGTPYGPSLTLVCSWQLRALFLPSASSTLSGIFYHLLGPSLSLALCFLASLPQGFLGKQWAPSS